MNLNTFRDNCLELSPLKLFNESNYSHLTIDTKVLVVYAENDSPAFHYQSSQFVKVSNFLVPSYLYVIQVLIRYLLLQLKQIGRFY